LQNGALDPAPFATASITSHGSPGGALTLSADGKKSGTGILWGTLTTGKSADHGTPLARCTPLTPRRWNSFE